MSAVFYEAKQSTCHVFTSKQILQFMHNYILSLMICVLLICTELIFHPFTPLYLVGKAISYHSYLVAMKFKESYPRYDRETPEHFKKILNEFAQSELHGGDSYDEETNVIKQRQAKLQENLSAISERDLKNPHIKFFAERNPGHKEVFYLSK